ncbi:MAG: heme NO-binding domain-containing protein [Bacteroidetes bacterium]|nr:heme NO-binding domain-containing protein [Bacteroidota bacterium]
MYGIVNKAIQGLVTENFGEKAWNEVKIKSGVNVKSFLSNEPYPDDITYKLAGAASEVLNISLRDVLISFGEYWVLKTGQQHYGSLMQAGGNNLKEFLINLPGFHSRVMLIYPKLTPPEFKISDIEENSLHVHYYSQRKGLKDFVFGLLQGLGKMYKTETQITLLQNTDEGFDHNVFLVKW